MTDVFARGKMYRIVDVGEVTCEDSFFLLKGAKIWSMSENVFDSDVVLFAGYCSEDEAIPIQDKDMIFFGYCCQKSRHMDPRDGRTHVLKTYVRLNDGIRIPIAGLPTWSLQRLRERDNAASWEMLQQALNDSCTGVVLRYGSIDIDMVDTTALREHVATYFARPNTTTSEEI